MNYAPRKLSFWMLAFCLMLTVAISPALATAQASSSGAGSAAKPAAPAIPAQLRLLQPRRLPPATWLRPRRRASRPVRRLPPLRPAARFGSNTESGVYHKSGRWYGKTKNGKFMTEAEAKAAGYKEAQR